MNRRVSPCSRSCACGRECLRLSLRRLIFRCGFDVGQPHAPGATGSDGMPRFFPRASMPVWLRACAWRSPCAAAGNHVHVRSRASRCDGFCPTRHPSRAGAGRHRRAGPSTARWQSPASKSARRACRAGCAPSLRARTLRPAWSGPCPRAGRAGPFRWCVSLACRSPVGADPDDHSSIRAVAYATARLVRARRNQASGAKCPQRLRKALSTNASGLPHWSARPFAGAAAMTSSGPSPLFSSATSRS